jgi:predicted RNA binding protein YcfA (HicA-like mRNA interferase family)
MGRLAGFSYREVVKRLRALGFVFDRQAAGSHEIWRHEETGYGMCQQL